MFCQQNIINLLTKLVKKYVPSPPCSFCPVLTWDAAILQRFFQPQKLTGLQHSCPTSEWCQVLISHSSTRREKRHFFSPPNTKMWLLQILSSSSSSFFDFLIIFVTNLQRVKCSSFFKRLQMNKTRCFPKNCTFYDFTEKWVKKTLKMD